MKQEEAGKMKVKEAGEKPCQKLALKAHNMREIKNKKSGDTSLALVFYIDSRFG